MVYGWIIHNNCFGLYGLLYHYPQVTVEQMESVEILHCKILKYKERAIEPGAKQEQKRGHTLKWKWKMFLYALFIQNNMYPLTTRT